MSKRTPLKDHLRETRLFTARAVTALVCVAVLMLAVVLRLVYLQVISHEHFTTLSENYRVNIVPIPPNRGLIFDRKGVLLAQNMPSFSLELVPEQIKNMDATIASLGEIIALDQVDLDEFKKRLGQRHPYEGIALRLRLSEEEVARFAVNRFRFLGVVFLARLSCVFLLGLFVVFAVGYVGRINENELKELDSSNFRGSGGGGGAGGGGGGGGARRGGGGGQRE